MGHDINDKIQYSCNKHLHGENSNVICPLC